MAWATTSAMNVARYSLAGCGTTTDALSFGGHTGAIVATTEKWNGTVWATTTVLNQAKNYLAGCGTTTDALSFGGEIAGPISLATTEKWNGTAWATTSSLNQAKSQLAGCGTTTDAFSFGGYTGVVVATTEKWNGSVWATTSSLNQAKTELAGCGTITDALSFGGNTGAAVATTERWVISKLSGICKDKNGVAITGVQCAINIYNKDSLASRVGSTLSNSVDGTWTNDIDIVVGTKTLALFSYEGTYGGDTDIAGGEFMTTVAI